MKRQVSSRQQSGLKPLSQCGNPERWWGRTIAHFDYPVMSAQPGQQVPQSGGVAASPNQIGRQNARRGGRGAGRVLPAPRNAAQNIPGAQSPLASPPATGGPPVVVAAVTVPAGVQVAARRLPNRVPEDMLKALCNIFGEVENGPFPCTEAGMWNVLETVKAWLAITGHTRWVPKFGRSSGAICGLSWTLKVGKMGKPEWKVLGYEVRNASSTRWDFYPLPLYTMMSTITTVCDLDLVRLPEHWTDLMQPMLLSGARVGVHEMSYRGFTFLEASPHNWVAVPSAALAEVQALTVGRPVDPQLVVETVRRLRSSLKHHGWGEDISGDYAEAIAVWVLRKKESESLSWVPAALRHKSMAAEYWSGSNWHDYLLEKKTWFELVNPDPELLRPVVQPMLLILFGMLAGWLLFGEGSLAPAALPVSVLAAWVLAAVSEEVLKKAWPGFSTVLIIMVEWWSDGFSRRYVPTAMVHVVCSYLPLVWAVSLHVLWNVMVWWTFVPAVLALPLGVDKYLEATSDVCVCEFLQPPYPPIAPGCSVALPEVAFCNQPRRPAVRFVAVRVEGVVTSMYRACMCNEEAAVRRRVTVDSLGDNPEWVSWFRKARRVGPISVPTLQDWLEHLDAKQLSAMEKVIGTTERHDLTIDAFVKRELAVFSIDGCQVKEVLKPRLIQGRRPVVRLATGPSTWAYGKALADAYHYAWSRLVYAGGMTAEGIGDWYARMTQQLCHAVAGRMPVWVSIDCTRWDSTVGPTPMSLLYGEYTRAGFTDDALHALKGRDGTRKGRTAGGIKYKVTATVASGDGDTSAGNSRLHLVMLESCPAVLAGAVMGDDSLIYTRDVEAVLEHYRKGGMQPELAPDIDFCSQLVWPVGDGKFVLGPKIGRVLSKTFQCRHLMPGRYLGWLRGVCIGMNCSASFVPILRVLVPRLEQLSGHSRVVDVDDYPEKIRASQRHEVSDETWEFFFVRYGVSKVRALELESQIARMELGDVLRASEFKGFVTRDIIGT